ncbi:MAG: HD-GYP domain-containing protein [Acidobacteriota bacterium]|nr:HD-GYP domain-containing protein [Acidobacteriota bacterium]
MKKSLVRQFAAVNSELWLILSLFVIAALCNFVVANRGILLSFYTFPTLFSAYYYGRRHATMTAFASLLLVVLITWFNPHMFERGGEMTVRNQSWYDIGVWGGSLIITAFAMGALYDRNQAKVRELRDTYHGVLMILRHFISKDTYTQNHSYRVSIYAAKIAIEMGFDDERVEDVRAAALLHDIGKLDISREVLYKAARLNSEELKEMKEHVSRGVSLLEPVGGSLRRILPIILAHHDRYDGSGYTDRSAEEIPIEARILSVADAYDAIIADRPYRKGSTPFEARDIIERGAGKEFDPNVVEAFLGAFRKQQLEIPDLVV